MLTGGLLPSVDFFIINVSLPSIHASLGADPAELQLVVSGYAASYAVFLITGGRLGDLYGRRRLFLDRHGRLRRHQHAVRPRRHAGRSS